LIEETTGQKIAPDQIPLDDGPTFDLLSRAQNIGVFQVESPGMCDLCRRLKPSKIEDIIALVALYRPGPMENIPAYSDRKLGTVPIEYDHPLLEPILKETYGIMIYQEQVMQAAQALAGYTLGSADVLRKAMGKKKPEEMAKQRAIFIEGCAKTNGIKPDKADQLFDVLDKFAGYGFNKAHSACYGLLAYQTAYLKARYPVQFMAALLSNELGNTDKIEIFVGEAKGMGINVQGPNVNSSGSVFTVGDRSIRFGLSAIKNVGQAAVELIIAARKEGGPFSDMHDLCSRVESRAFNKKLLESLVKSGACDDFGENRAELLTQIDGALAQANAKARDRADGQGSLLDLLGPADPVTKKTASKAAAVTDFSPSERLRYEKELLGFYVSGHPLDEHRIEVNAFALHNVAQLREFAEEIDTRLCGLITKVEIRVTKEGKKPWARVTFEDLTGALEVLVFPDTYAALPKALATGDVMVICGQLDRRDDAPKLRATQVLSLPEACDQLLTTLVLRLSLDDWLDPARWAQLRELVMDTPGPVKLRLVCSRANGGENASIELAPADHYGVTWTPELRAKLESFLGGASYELRAKTQVVRAKRKAWQQRASA
jgi:DNA polymerase-3 subunit alpha